MMISGVKSVPISWYWMENASQNLLIYVRPCVPMTNESSVSTAHSHAITTVEHVSNNGGLGNQGASFLSWPTFLMHGTKFDAGRSLMAENPLESVDESENRAKNLSFLHFFVHI